MNEYADNVMQRYASNINAIEGDIEINSSKC